MVPTRTFTTVLTTRPPWDRALVVGGAGFLGSHLCARLVDMGVEVDCADNLSTGRRENVAWLADRPGFRFLESDISQPGCVDALTGPYDLVLHFACPASPADCRRLPLETLDAGSAGTRHALAVADRDDARLLFASASEVYGEPLVTPQREDYRGNVDPVGPRSAYAESKRFAEALLTAHVAAVGTDAGIVRLFDTYGPRMRTDDGRVVSTFLRRALAGEPLPVAGDGGRTHCLCYVDDMVEGVLLLAASRSVRPVNLGGCDETTEAEIARRVLHLTGSRSRLALTTPAVGDGTGAPLDHLGGTPTGGPRRACRPDTTFVRELFGWLPRTGWEEGLERTIDHFTGPGPAPGGRPAREPYRAIGAGTTAEPVPGF